MSNKINTPINMYVLPESSGSGDENARVALRGVRLEATISALTLKASLEQTFVNQERRAIEAIYTFPLPETAAVCGFEVRTGDHVLTGKVEESDRALQQYDEAIGGGHGAYLLEQDRPDVFTTRVGNLKPNQAATIAVGFVAPVERVDRSIRVRIPTTIAPRYVSAVGTNDPLQSALDGDVLNPPHALHVPYGVQMRIQVQLGAEVQKISSPTHAIQVTAPNVEQGDAGGGWVVSFTGEIAQMDRDVVLEIDVQRELQPAIQLAAGPDDAKYLAITFLPEFDEAGRAEARASETVFLLDCSGSMHGESISQANAALELCLRSLSLGDTFNICRFGSTYNFLSQEPLVYSADTLELALRYINGGADLGGTEIYAPLEELLTTAPQRGSVRNVVVLTDGQVTNEPAVIELARKWRRLNRLFTFGIGSAASGFLVRGLARVSGGAAEFISGNERIEDKVLRTFSRIGSPVVSDLNICWGDAELQTPGDLPPLFDGDLLQVLARAPGKLPSSVTLECITPHGKQRWELPVPSAEVRDHGAIATAWARAMIQHLEDGESPSNTVRKRESSMARRMVTLSKQFNLLCSQTAFIAIEHRTLEERNSGQTELRRVPLKLAHGWGGEVMCASVDYSLMAGAPCATPASSPPPASVAAVPGGDGIRSLRKAFDGIRAILPKRGRMADASRPSFGYYGASEKNSAAEGVDTLHELLAIQSADGWFADEYALLLASVGRDVISIQKQMVRELAAFLPAQEPLASRTVATLVVLAAFRTWFEDRKALWRRAELKARRWLTSNTTIQEAAMTAAMDALRV